MSHEKNTGILCERTASNSIRLRCKTGCAVCGRTPALIEHVEKEVELHQKVSEALQALAEFHNAEGVPTYYIRYEWIHSIGGETNLRYEVAGELYKKSGAEILHSREKT